MRLEFVFNNIVVLIIVGYLIYCYFYVFCFVIDLIIYFGN